MEYSGLLLRFGSNILQKRLIGHMAKNKYSITCVHQSVFSHLKTVRCSSENGQLVALENALVDTAFFPQTVKKKFFPSVHLVAMMWNIHGSNVLLVSHFEEYY